FLVPLWKDREGTVPQANPFQSDSDGFFRVYADPGVVGIKAVSGGLERRWEHVAVDSGADVGLRADLASSLPGNGIDLVAGGVKALGSNLTFAVPTDYATLQEAIDELSKIYRAGQGVTIT